MTNDKLRILDIFNIKDCEIQLTSRFSSEEDFNSRRELYAEKINSRELVNLIVEDMTKKSKNTDDKATIYFSGEFDKGIIDAIEIELDKFTEASMECFEHPDSGKIFAIEMKYKIKRNTLVIVMRVEQKTESQVEFRRAVKEAVREVFSN